MESWIWLIIPALLIGGGRFSELVQNALKTRHTRRLELLKAVERRQQNLEAANRPPEPVCGCTHHLAKHDRAGKCHEMVEAATAWDSDRRPTRYEPRMCTCQQYIGPEPLGTIFAQEIVDPG